MAAHIRKNVENPTYSFYHHDLIKMLILVKLKKKIQSWEQFVLILPNPHVGFPVETPPAPIQPT